MKLSQELRKRGLIHDATENIDEVLDSQKPVFYLGADPTADSLHVGHLLTYITAKRLVDAGLSAILIVGGGTGRIGDPKPNAERVLLDEKEINKNLKALKKQVKKLLGRKTRVVDNYTWLKKLTLIDFLRDIGKNFTVNSLIKKDAIAMRLKSDIGLSYTEFAYPLLQAFDFWELNRRYGCTLQIGGSDQWGNIVAGVDLIRKKSGKEAHAFTIPLLVDKKTGKKFGKSEGNAIWLDESKTSVYEFYQFFINTPDEIVEDLLLKLTFLSLDEIERILNKWKNSPAERLAQKTLAFEVTKFVHGEKQAQTAKQASEILFSNPNSFSKNVADMLKNTPIAFSFNSLPTDIVDVLVEVGLAKSKREARDFLNRGAVSVFDRTLSLQDSLSKDDFKDKIALLKRGKKQVRVIYL